MKINQLKRTLQISQEIIELAEKKGWKEVELVEAMNLLSSKTKSEIDNKSAVRSLI